MWYSKLSGAGWIQCYSKSTKTLVSEYDEWYIYKYLLYIHPMQINDDEGI